MRCLVMRGLAKELEDDLNEFLAAHDVDVFRMTQGAHGECIALTLLYEERTPRSATAEAPALAACAAAAELQLPNNRASSRECTRDALEYLARPQEVDVADPGDCG